MPRTPIFCMVVFQEKKYARRISHPFSNFCLAKARRVFLAYWMDIKSSMPLGRVCLLMSVRNVTEVQVIAKWKSVKQSMWYSISNDPDVLETIRSPGLDLLNN